MFDEATKIRTLRTYGTFDDKVCYAAERLKKMDVQPFSGRRDGTQLSIFQKALQQATKENKEVAVFLRGTLNGLFVLGPHDNCDDIKMVENRFNIYVKNQEEFRFDKPIEEQKREQEFDRFRTLAYKEAIFDKYGSYSVELCYADERLQKLGVKPYSRKEVDNPKDVFEKKKKKKKRTGKNVAVNFNGTLKGLFVLSPKENDFDTFMQNQEKLRWDKPILQQKAEEKMMSDSLNLSRKL